MDLRNCYAVVESTQGVLDRTGGFFGLVSRHCSCSLEEKGVRHVYIEVVIRDCRPRVMSVKSLLIQLRRSPFITVLKQGKLSPPLDKGRNRTCRLISSVLFFHRKANSLVWVCCITVSGTESMEAV